MKKVLMILLTLAMVFSMAGVVSADDTTDITGNSGNTEVTYNTEQGYIVTIPTKVAFAEGSLESANFVKATNVLLPDGALLEVNVSSPNDFNLVYGSGLTVSKIPYIVTKYDGNIAVNNDPVLQVASGVTESSADLTFSTTEENVKQATLSGEHKDTLEFTVTVKGGSTSGDTQEPSVIYIGNKEQLLAFAADVNDGNTYEGKTVKLTADIDLQNEEWTPIGPNADAVNKFKGTFDGQGHTISNLNVDTAAGYTAAGFFGALNGVAKNFVIDGATIKHVSTGDPSDNGIAVVAGSLYNKGTIDGVTVKNAVVEGNRYTGGISGYTYGTVKNCKVIDSEITAIPNTFNGNYDNGDKVGGIAGYWSSESAYSMIGNIVENVVLKAYRDVGGIVGTANGVTADNLKDNTVKDVIIIVDQKTNTYGDKTKNAGEIVECVTNGALADGANTAENVVIYENYVKPDVDYAINLAGLTGSILVELGEGNYGDVTFPSNAKITFIGAGKDKTTIDFGNDHEGATGCTLVFDGIKLKRSTNTNYNGIQSLTSATYNDCAFEGQHFLYGTKAVFNKCVFTTTDAENYNVWTYGVAEVTFNTCQFTCAGKSVLIYNEGHGGQIANFNGCTFTATAPVDGKAAIEVDSSLLQGGQTYTVNIDSTTTASGFATGSVSGNTLWNVKKDASTSTTTVKVGGEPVYPTTTP